MKYREEVKQGEGDSGNRGQRDTDQTGKPQGAHGNKQDAAGQYEQPGADAQDNSSGSDPHKNSPAKQ